MIYRLFVLWLILALIPIPIPAQRVLPAKEKQAETQSQTSVLPEEEQDKLNEEMPPRSLEGPIDPDTYILGPSDRLLLIIGGPERTTLPFEILPEGSALLPNIGPFQAAGLTLREFTRQVREKLGRYYRNVDIDCSLARPRSFVVYVLGEVMKPGPVELFAPFPLSRALAGAGGVSAVGSRREIEIHEQGRLVCKVDLLSFLKLGNFEGNPTLREGQSVVVPFRKRTVKALGEVGQPGYYEMLKGETVEDLLAMCGGVAAWGDKDRMIIERVMARDSVSTITFSYDEIGRIELENQDVLVVSDILSFPQNRFVYVTGGGGRQGRFLLQPGETLKQFLPRTWRVAEQFTVDTALLERKNAAGDVEVIRFNPKDVFSADSLGDIELRPGDKISIPPLAESVYVAGEVTEPGEYVYHAEFKVEEYISMAGGPTSKGSFNRISIISRDGRSRNAGKDSLVKRGETILVKQRYASMLGSFVVSVGSLSAIVLSIVALSRTSK
jgi:protein involved in polysaccharide export with SLBB domain